MNGDCDDPDNENIHISNGYHSLSGTSMAAPFVTGVAALMVSVNPELSPQNLRESIINNSDSITISVPDTDLFHWDRTKDINVKRLNAMSAVSAVANFETNVLSDESIEIIGLFGRELFGIIQISEVLNNRSVVSIGASAFANQTGLTGITIPSSITTIGANAFKGCTSLTDITIPAGVTSIGNGAFAGCNNLNISVSPANPNFSAQGNILYNKNKTKIIASGEIASDIIIPNTVTEISPYAFDGNSNLVSVRFAGTPTIGAYAFNNCPNMNSVYFDAYDLPTVGANSFSNNDFVLYTRYNAQAAYRNIFSVYTDDVVSIPVLVSYISSGQVIETRTVYNGSTISNLPITSKTGYDFAGWYKNNSTGRAYHLF